MSEPQPFPLTRANRILLARAFRHVPRVDLSIDCVIEDQMGSATVDSVENPTAFKIQVGPFVYFAGEAESPAGRALLQTLAPYTLLMASTPGWAAAALEKFGERLVAIDRFSFSSDNLSESWLINLIDEADLPYPISLMDDSFAARLWDQDHFVYLGDYESPADFARRGVGFYAEHANEIIGAAYASLVCSRGIEISLFVEEAFRRQGVALVLSARLLLWCLERGMHPNWDAANLASCRLAEKLGYRPAGRYKAYYLKQ